MSERTTAILRALAQKLEKAAFADGEQSKVMHLKKAYAVLNFVVVAYAPVDATSNSVQDEIAFALAEVVLASEDARCAAWGFDLAAIKENLMVLLGAAPDFSAAALIPLHAHRTATRIANNLIRRARRNQRTVK